ncbi:formylglycine-generating enzyme family protein [Chondromyces crocatus]|uniref:Sulfatase-modifying factor enzyme-like domain-containing protein n=1 Tax=Chondromyces crocatus TaxID=52 RepID=A0A0K1ER50_CHOCO|nr:formylglycine-generating enzyme family protein [Chondromyces crocatus]AKT43122.1 uncharacterized protein CMC5_073500 [Chondromyces crocatus]
MGALWDARFDWLGWGGTLLVGAFLAGACSGDEAARGPSSHGDGGHGGDAGSGDAGGGATGGGDATGGAGPGGGGPQEPLCGSSDVQPPTPPSCTSGAPGTGAHCGPEGTSCCASHLVPCGTYRPGYDGVTFDYPSPPATVGDFQLDVYEITVGRFRAFVDAGQGTQEAPPAITAGRHPRISNSGWRTEWNIALPTSTSVLRTRIRCHDVHTTWTDAPGPNEALPMNCISWFEAFAFCAWDGGRLPTETEWNHAAAGGDQQREYPWGSGIDDTRAVYGCLQGNCSADFISAVGSRSPGGNGRWGHTDLAGSMTEWTLDWFVANFTPGCVDCASVDLGTERVLRGGGFISPATPLLAAYRNKAPPIVGDVAGRYRHVGARCARDL